MDVIHNLKSVEATLRKYQSANSALLDIADSLDWQSRVSGIAAAVASMEKYAAEITPIQSKLAEIAGVVDSPAFKLANSANLSILRTIEKTQSIGKSFESLARVSEEWEKRIKPLTFSIDSALASQAVLNLHLAKSSGLALLAQNSMSKISWPEIGRAFKLQGEQKSALRGRFVGMAESFSGFMDTLEKIPSDVFSFPPIITRLPSVEFYNSAHLLETVSVETTGSIVREEEQTRQEILTETEAALQELLIDLKPDLAPLWKGAIAALNSDNPDRVRHFVISMRELLTHVLHMLSPDTEVRKWTSSPECYKDGDPKKPPTRRGRLQFICRNIAHGPFSSFIDKDVTALLEFIDLFQRGTHEITAPYTQSQLQALKIRAESAIRYIIEISRSSRA